MIGDKKASFSSDKSFANVIRDDTEYFPFELTISPDSWPYRTDLTKNRTGFFFAVTGLEEAKKEFDPIL